jgi:cysteinyl-tRNA synthetase
VPAGLYIYDTLRGRREPFETVAEGRVQMLVCGPTVQNLMHVGHARTDIFFDTVARYLSHLGYSVTFLMNITDIDDSILKSAQEEKANPWDLSQKYANSFIQDTAKLNVRSITKYPRVSHYIPKVIQLIEGLIASRHAYSVDGYVYMDTSRVSDFGQLSHMSAEELTLRPTEISPTKRHLTDFALWRPSTSPELRWDSPWGPGRPGWHIQDVGISLTELGPQYDIHGGARELIYPHHESLIAEAQSVTGVSPYVRFWMHTGLLTIDKKKMSKSEGNVVTVRDALSRHGTSQLRLYFLLSHYREDMEFDETKLTRVDEEFWRLKEKATRIKERASTEKKAGRLGSSSRLFFDAMNDDFGTPLAIAHLSRLVEEGVTERSLTRLDSCLSSISKLSSILGVNLLE